MTPIRDARGLALAAAGHARAAGTAITAERDPVKGVHLARRHIKRARSFLRALKPLAAEESRRQNLLMRGFAHALAPLRDVHAQEEAARLVGAAAGARGGGPSVDLAAVARGLKRQARSIERMRIERASSRRFLAEAVARFYRRARRAYGAYREQPSPEALHEARKRIKDCLHLVEGLDDIRPKGSVPKPGRLDRLGELLGAIRDLDLLAQRLRLDRSNESKLVRIAARHLRLERAAARAGRSCFAAKPRAVRKAWKRL